MHGSLTLVSTHLGNSSDISKRALDKIAGSDLVLCEDTRTTNRLLAEYGISKPLIAYTDQKHTRLQEYIIGELSMGKDLVLVSDNGTPAISDPGFKLIRLVKELGYKISIIPGPNAAVSALAISGLPTDKFTFLGFLPKKTNQRVDLLKTYGQLDSTLTIYESPYRVYGLLCEILEVLGNRVVCIAKDLTKDYEEVYTDYLENLIKLPLLQKQKGEFVVLISKADYIWTQKSIN